VSDRWEEGFDSWTPRADAAAGDEPPAEIDRGELHRLARELAAQRERDQDAARSELEALKESLRERAAAVADRERELVELQRRLEKKGGRKAAAPAVDTEAVSARERAALERLQAVEERERELTGRAAELAAEAAAVEAMRTELAALRDELQASAADRELAAAERERLEERLEDARRAEKELAAQRLALERQRDEIEARERAAAAAAAAERPSDDTQPDPYAERENELRRLETRLEARERELALMRQGLDAQRIELREQERAVRRRDAADARQSFGPPLRPPSFSDGLAAFVSSRNRT